MMLIYVSVLGEFFLLGSEISFSLDLYLYYGTDNLIRMMECAERKLLTLRKEFSPPNVRRICVRSSLFLGWPPVLRAKHSPIREENKIARDP